MALKSFMRKVGAAIGSTELQKKRLKRARLIVAKWIVDDAKMTRTDQAIFMHCLPVRRNVIVSDSVIDSPASVVN
jgi:ornithine carbamoyltransferase